ncbi:hypothetical protein H632_c335p1 [Helicosporidium sp. ATCC 50920]|nr:hypothetical protein H632_c335p1 [Helicosporidium sp. ATCC 50920]|eukprot:KDD76154.1 hypothetical protein H632_c335p1 [Helicosporidium sp. ATCC 50920]
MTIRTIETPLNESVVHVAYDETHLRMATGSSSGLSVRLREEPARTWAQPRPVVLPPGISPTCLSWSSTEAGPLLAAGTSQGSVVIWSNVGGEGTGESSTSGPSVAEIPDDASSPVVAVAFAPSNPLAARQHPPLLAAACQSGSVHVFKLSEDRRREWEPAYTLTSSSNRGQGGRATCLAWRPHAPAEEGVPPLLAVGLEKGGAQIWMFREMLFKWEIVAELNTPSLPPVSAIAWGPLLGGEEETLVVARGSTAEVWALSGPADALRAERAHALQHAYNVWKAEFAAFGGWLACATEDAKVCLWRATLSGEYRCLHTVEGKES